MQVGLIFLIGIFGYLIVHELSQIKDLLRQISELLTQVASASETCEKSLPSIENDIAAIKRKIEKRSPPSDW